MVHDGWIKRGLLSLWLLAAGCEAVDDGDMAEESESAASAQSAELRRWPKPPHPPHPPRPPRPDAGAHVDGGTPAADAGAPESPCALIDCHPGERCEEKVLPCLVAPCPVEPVCVPIEPALRCANVRCKAGTHCVDDPSGPVCKPDAPAPDAGGIGRCATVLCPSNTRCEETPTGPSCVPLATCAVTLCAAPSTCVDTPSGAQCVPIGPSCTGQKCEPGTHCELIDVVCVRAPCPPQPSCVPDVTDPCATVRCTAGTHCEAKQVVCKRAPCPPVAQCVAN